MDRQQILNQLQENQTVSVLIIGGGINGLGTFRDLALQGVDVLLVEKNDFCSGASAASSHMVHGGVRYLENGEFRLVREAVHERNRLLKNAPHYVTPLPTTIPLYKLFSGIVNAPLKFLRLLDKPGERGAAVIKIGLMLYDSYTREQGKQSVPGHRLRGRAASLREFPQMNPDIIGTATYYDGAMSSPERIAVEVMRDGEEANRNAHALNYVSAVGAAADTVTLRDEETGETYTVKPKIVINAAGPWIDFANDALGRKTRMMAGTKGSHIVVDHPELYAATRNNEIFFENKDGRIVLVYPLAGKVIIGTTDTPISNPSEARCTDEEVAYFFEFTKHVFPAIQLKESDIVYRFSGVRPLPRTDAKTAGQITRDHKNELVPPGNGIDFPTYNLVGGKWTSFRAFSEQVTDTVLAKLGKARVQSTADRAIGGGRAYPADKKQWANDHAAAVGLPPARLEMLLERYGTLALPMGAFIVSEADSALESLPDYSVRELQYLVEKEQVRRIGDLLQRRSLLAMTGQLSAVLVMEVADIIGDVLGWDSDRKETEIDRFAADILDKHGVIL